jgi:hypothetical protein
MRSPRNVVGHAVAARNTESTGRPPEYAT